MPVSKRSVDTLWLSVFRYSKAGKIHPKDRRSREAIISPAGKLLTDAVDAARERLARRLLADWDTNEID